MDNPVVIRLAEVAETLGIATLRFNFRGVGASTGQHGGGEAEVDDVHGGASGHGRAASRGTRPLASPATPLVRRSPPAWPRPLPISLPWRWSRPRLECTLSTSSCALPDPTLLVAGTKDQYCPEDALRRLGDRLTAEVDIIEGAEHFFFGKLFPLGQAVERWLRRWAV